MLARKSTTESFEFRPDVVATELEDGAVLFDLETKYFYRLNRSGWAIAQLFESGATLGDVFEYSQALGAPPEDEAAVTALIDALSRDKLIQAVGDHADPQARKPDVAGPWCPPTIERQAEPLQRVIISAFDPSVPLVE